MSSSQFSLSARVSASYSELSSIATDLNAVSDAFGKAVADIDDGLKKLNLGVTAWVRVDSCYGNERPEDRTYRIEEIGYAKITGKWGIAIRTRIGDEDHPEEADSMEDVPFNDAPRASRLKAVEKIPELLSKLSEEAAKVTKELQKKLADVQVVASAVRDPTPQLKSPPHVKGALARAAMGRGSMTPPPRAPGSPDPNATPEAKL